MIHQETDAVASAVAAALEAAAKWHDAEIARLEAQIAENKKYMLIVGKSERSDANDFCEGAILIHRISASTIRALITPAQHDALAAHVAAEVAKARAEERDRCIKLAEYYREVCGRNQDGDFYVGEEAAQFGASVADEIIEAIAQIGAKP